jgi:hypothetical protein
MSDRGVHPDLIDDEQAAAPAAETPSPPRRGRAARAAAASSPEAAAEAPPAAQHSESASALSENAAEAQATTEPPEWRIKLKEAVEAGDDSAVQRLLIENRNDVVSGHVGQIVRRQREREAREAIEQQKREALANADFYGLGQLSAQEVRAQVEQSVAAQQSAPFMDGVTQFQAKLPPEVQAEVQGKTYGVGKSHAEGVAEYLDAVVQAALRHGQQQVVEQELQRREPALRKAWLSETNAGQPVPELDGGRAAVAREITDEQVGRMGLAEYDQYFDERGQPRPGTRVRLTRGIPLNRR